jgi:eukaryotic-like serine/threonine-protein kinase
VSAALGESWAVPFLIDDGAPLLLRALIAFGYMSPEQLSGGEVDERSDLFSVGVVAAEAVAGERPFKGRTLVELLNSMGRDEFTLDAEGPEAARLVACVRRALAKEPASRFASAEEMRSELVAALRACPPLAGPALDADTVMLEKTRMK